MVVNVPELMGSDVMIIFLMSPIWMVLRSLLGFETVFVSPRFCASGKVVSGGRDFCEYQYI